MSIKPPKPTGASFKDPTFDQFPNPRGKKINKYPFKDLCVVYIGNKDEIQEVTICRKENNQYIDLLSETSYSKNQENNDIQVLKEFTLVSLLSKTNIKSKDLILENGYLTDETLITLYKALNEDTELKYKDFTYHRGPVWHDCPSFCFLFKNKDHIFEKEEKDQDLIKLNLALSIGNKIPIITGEKGIGKSTLRNKLNNCITDTNPYMKNKEIWTIDYKELIKGTITNKHIEERLIKIQKFFSRFNNRILFIDNADLENETFLSNVIKINSENLRIILISDKKLEKENIDTNTFELIDISKPKEKVINAILLKKIIEESEKTNLKSDFNSEELDELLSILFHCDDKNSINIVENENNPKLGTTIIKNAYKIAIALNDPEVTVNHYIEAIKQDNVSMDNQNKNIAVRRLDNLDVNVKIRKISEEEQKENQKKKSTLKDKIKTIFRR
ncbi:MAG: hypothetical protein IJN90_06905 [Bacilli bacterium]|nr:hypothetical protein [Bacilli bacterium]